MLRVHDTKLAFQILRNRKRLKSESHRKLSKDVEDIDPLDLENNLRFDPPVYRQRYAKVYEILLNERWRNSMKKVVDFGCAEFGLFMYLKNLNLQEIVFVDIDESLLDEKIGKIEPLLVDRLRRRNNPLEISVYRGSVSDPDYRLRKTDVVTAVELIEHLFPDTLDAFPYNIFSFIRPKLAILTTPNSDFNIMFGRRQGFRHPDHKFEWTREQFEDWSTNIIKRFPDYIVDFYGVGEGPDHTKNIGCCSQAAVFIRKDVLQEKYISPVYIRSCQCGKNSLCKGQTTESKLICSCLCAFCLPDFSVGVCTYLSCNLKDTDAYRPMKTDPKKSISDTELPKCMLHYNMATNNFSNDINPSYNIFYKLIQKIDYPYEIDPRSENEKILGTLRYRITTFSHVNSRFYMEEKGHCEIPIRDIMYGDIAVSFEEIRHLLLDGGYQIEKCTIPETGQSEFCIISAAQEMEDITNSSDVTDEYSSKSSELTENTNFEAEDGHLSDWDEIAYVPIPKEEKSLCKQVSFIDKSATSSSCDPSLESQKSDVNPPIDTLVTTDLQSPPLALQGSPEHVETDQFEDVVTTPNFQSDDNKLHLKKTIAKEKFMGALGPMAENQRNKVDLNRINELDRFHNMGPVSTFMNNHLKPQCEFKWGAFKDVPVAGTSNTWKKSRKIKEKEKRTVEKKGFEEPTVLDDAKSLTNCIIQNSLNIIEVECAITGPHSELIRDLSPLPEPDGVNEVIQREDQNVPNVQPEPQDSSAPVGAVKNEESDLSNRDNEGDDSLNDNLEHLVPLLENNANVIENNYMTIGSVQMLKREQEETGSAEGNNTSSDFDMIGLTAEDSIAQASREVLYDVNSEQDMLEDFDIPPQPNQDNIFDVLNVGNRVILVGIRPVNSSDTRTDQPAAASIETNTSSFPNWLLQILGSHIVPEEGNQTLLGSHDEPHFYCQGDGLGVHPSVIAVDIDEAEDADDDTTEGSSSNNTVDYAEVDPGPSDIFDMTSLPEESSRTISLTEENTLRTARSVIFSEIENENIVPLYPSTNDPQIISIANETVNDLIRAAGNEITRRSMNLTALENLPTGLSESEVSGGLDKYKQNDNGINNVHSASGTSTYEQELHEGLLSTVGVVQSVAQSDISDVTDYEISQGNNRYVTPDNSLIEGGSEQHNLNKRPKTSDIREVQSFNESEKSEYFDPRTE